MGINFFGEEALRKINPFRLLLDLPTSLKTQDIQNAFVQPKQVSKRETSIVKAHKERMSPEVGAPAPETGHAPRIPFLTAVYH